MKYKIFMILGTLVLLVPLGLLSDSPAWGEWESEYYMKILGFIPKGIADAKGIKPLLPDYSLGSSHPVLWYYVSALLGAGLIYIIMLMLSKIGTKNAK